eukprot:5408293-Amphidinium_carterae.1
MFLKFVATGQDIFDREAEEKALREARANPTALLPESVDKPIGELDEIMTGAGTQLPERHIQLFRQLQAKWQCYDAYCRVCMGLGTNQMLQALIINSALYLQSKQKL